MEEAPPEPAPDPGRESEFRTLRRDETIGTSTLRMIACGKICSSYKAEMSALNMVLTEILDNPEAMKDESKIWIFTDSESAVKRIEAGPGAQTDSLADEIW